MTLASVWIIDENQIDIEQPLQFSACTVKQIIVRFPPIPRSYWQSDRFRCWYEKRKTALERYIAKHSNLPDAPTISLEVGSVSSLMAAVA